MTPVPKGFTHQNLVASLFSNQQRLKLRSQDFRAQLIASFFLNLTLANDSILNAVDINFC